MHSWKRFFVLVLLLTSATFGLAQAGPPKAELVLPKTATPGQKIKAIVKLTFESGWHGYQNPPTKDYMIPLTIKSAVKGLVVKPTYPKGEVKDFLGEAAAVYEGEVEIPVLITVPKKAGKVAVKLDVSYQQCNDQTCLPPGTIGLSGTIQVKKK